MYSGGATALDVLFAAVPYVTMPTRTVLGRMGTSVATGVGVPELVAFSFKGYQDLAVKLGRTKALRHALQRRIEQSKTPPWGGRERDSVFNTAGWVKDMEGALLASREVQLRGVGGGDGGGSHGRSSRLHLVLANPSSSAGLWPRQRLPATADVDEESPRPQKLKAKKKRKSSPRV
jgi:hypothetical protein